MNTVNGSHYAVGFIIASFLSWLMTGLMRKIAIGIGLTDKPDGGRKIQKQPVPYLGGIGIMLSFIVTLYLGLFFEHVTRETSLDIFYLLLPAVIMGLVGLWDDIRNLSPHFRLMIQVIMGLTASLTITFGSTSGSATGNASFDLLISIIWIVGITNAINFFDNMDGGAAVASFVVSLGIALYSLLTSQPYIAGFAFLITGSLLGFFIWNRRPARIYMGDAGALFLGMLLATVAIRIDPYAETKFVSLAIPILFLALPIIDTSVVVIDRIRRGKSPLEGGKDHLSHRLALKGLRHRYILYIFALISATFQIAIFASIYVNKVTEIFFVAAAFIFFAFSLIYFSRLPIENEHKSK
jgi:UDP-GlcNAc:undecaprenyl-phosphate GlcNAc-1-phosphate transferase